MDSSIQDWIDVVVYREIPESYPILFIIYMHVPAFFGSRQNMVRIGCQLDITLSGINK